MKKLILIIAVLFAVFTVNAQRSYTYEITPAAVNGAVTVTFETVELQKGGTVSLQALCTNTGGTSDGTIWIEASVDGKSWETLTTTAGLFYGFPNDTLTILDAAVGMWVIEDNPFPYVRFVATGTASDSTLITPKYRPKSK